MSIVKQLDKRSGITYAYESISRWNKEKKQSRSTRKLIGHIKERLNSRRTLLSKDARLEGKLLVEFTALIYLSGIK